MSWIFNLAHFASFLIVFAHSDPNPYRNLPRIIVEDGNLVFQTSDKNNITFRTYGSGKININDQDLIDLVQRAQSSVIAMEQFRTIDVTTLSNQVEQLKLRLDEMDEVKTNVRELRQKFKHLFATVANMVGNNRGKIWWSLRKLTQKVVDINTNLSRISQTLQLDECASNPCRNGGSCIDNYNGFTCQCTENWQGSTCMEDVNECSLYNGTHLGCQNGGSCVNKPGGYECFCPPNWHGVNCNTNHDCDTQDNTDLCQNGYCTPLKRTNRNEPKYRCNCNPGWKTNNRTGACDIDINECDPNGPPRCSVNPRVTCTNIMGGFHCGHCPPGYEGNGQSCYDIDECVNHNGGCSIQPLVACENTLGSFICGRCPPGYTGDGRQCVEGICSLGNGDCHPLATCIENNAVYAGYRECRCPAGYSGNGIGPNGCQQLQPGQFGNACDSNPCVHGSCIARDNSFSCICYSGFNGTLCNRRWVIGQGCGGNLRGDQGVFYSPLYPLLVNRTESCVWNIKVLASHTVRLQFDVFTLTSERGCDTNYVEVCNGKVENEKGLISRFCGNDNPGVIDSLTSDVLVKMVTNANNTGSGFKISYWMNKFEYYKSSEIEVNTADPFTVPIHGADLDLN